MTRAQIAHREKAWRLWLARIVIVAIVARGLIPLGYMPEAPTQAHAWPALGICGGHMPMKDHGTAKDHESAPCPFSVNAIFAFDVDDTGLSGPTFVFIATLMMAAFALSATRRFGNASSRSPPHFS
jgi:hypothetical protein